MIDLLCKLFRIKRYTGIDCHHCDDPIRENHNQATAFYGRYTMRTICKPCMAIHLENIGR